MKNELKGRGSAERSSVGASPRPGGGLGGSGDHVERCCLGKGGSGGPRQRQVKSA